MARDVANSMGQIVWHRAGDVWEVRHIQDRNLSSGGLRRLQDIHELEELVRRDAEGHYRPLRSEGNLVAGWIYRANGEIEFREAMEVIYPGLWGNAEAWWEGRLRWEAWDMLLAKQTERLRKKTLQAGPMPQRVVEQNCKRRCLKTVLWAGELPEEKKGEMPMLCTGPCGLFWSCLEG